MTALIFEIGKFTIVTENWSVWSSGVARITITYPGNCPYGTRERAEIAVPMEIFISAIDGRPVVDLRPLQCASHLGG